MAGPYVFFKRVAGAIGAALNFPAFQNAGVRLRTRLQAIIGSAAAGVAVAQGPTTAVTRQAPAGNIVQTTVSLVHDSFVTVASESVASDWNDLAESEGDAADAGVATLEEGAVLVQGTLIGDFADFVNKDALSIDDVRLTCYYRVANLALPGTTLTIQYRIGDAPLGTVVVLKNIVGGIITDDDFLADGEEFDITADRAWTWQDLSDLQIEYVGTIAVDAGLSLMEVNATRLHVEGEATEAA